MDGRAEEDLRATFQDVLKSRQHRAHRRAPEAEGGVFSGHFPAPRAAVTTQQFFASVTPASTQQAVVRPGWRGRGTPIGQGRAMGPAGIQGEEPARALLHELADFGIGVQVPR
jgi:hypothetical protein